MKLSTIGLWLYDFWFYDTNGFKSPLKLFLYIWSKPFLKILWWWFLVPPCLECLLISSATLFYKTWNALTFSMLVYYNTNSFFWEGFHLGTCLFSSLIKVLSVIEHNVFILKFLCFMFLLSFITSKNRCFTRII